VDLLDWLRKYPKIYGGSALNRVQSELATLSLPAGHPRAAELERARRRLQLPAYLIDGRAFLADIAERPGLARTIVSNHYAARTAPPKSLSLSVAELREVHYKEYGPTNIVYRVTVSPEPNSGLNTDRLRVTVAWNGGALQVKVEAWS
jgi:hypothetical protein